MHQTFLSPTFQGRSLAWPSTSGLELDIVIHRAVFFGPHFNHTWLGLVCLRNQVERYYLLLPSLNQFGQPVSCYCCFLTHTMYCRYRERIGIIQTQCYIFNGNISFKFSTAQKSGLKCVYVFIQSCCHCVNPRLVQKSLDCFF